VTISQKETQHLVATNNVASLLLLHTLPDVCLYHIISFLDTPSILNFLSSHPRLYSLGTTATPTKTTNNNNHTAAGQQLYERTNNDRKQTETPQYSTRNCANVTNQHYNNNNNNNNNTLWLQLRKDRFGEYYYNDDDEKDHADAVKRSFLLHSYAQALPVVQWLPQRHHHHSSSSTTTTTTTTTTAATTTIGFGYIPTAGPSAREGHVACILGRQQEYLIVTGGFCNDDTIVYAKYVGEAASDRRNSNKADTVNREWYRIPCRVDPASITERPCSVYGATLTRLDAHRAIRFGGFQSGGYSDETSQVAVLTLHVNDDDDNDFDDHVPQKMHLLSYSWQVIPTQRQQNHQPQQQQPAASMDGAAPTGRWTSRTGEEHLARAYHTATLLHHRYLLCLGGMQSSRSVLAPALLDTRTWTWLDTTQTPICAEVPFQNASDVAVAPSGRHGHSVIVDEKRQRLVLFGGGSGSDLLRSGKDNTEVWELKFSSSPAPACYSSMPLSGARRRRDHGDDGKIDWNDLVASFPWQWRKLLPDQYDQELNQQQSGADQEEDSNNNNNMEGDNSGNRMEDDNNEERRQREMHHLVNERQSRHRRGSGNLTGSSPAASSQRIERNSTNCLSPAETLLLGRCHTAHKTAPDTVLLCFGAGRPSTNGVLAYDLSRDSFFRPRVAGPLPIPRFTCASVYLPKQGFIIFHGGYSSQRSSSLADLHVLDVAPGLRRSNQHPSPTKTRNSAWPSLLMDSCTMSHVPVTDHDAMQERSMSRSSIIDVILMNLGHGSRAERSYHLLEHLRASRRFMTTGQLGMDGMEDSGPDDDDDDGW